MALSTDDKAVVRRMWGEGAKQLEIAVAVGVSESAIWFFAKRNGLPKRPLIRKWPDKKLERLRQMWSEGLSCAKIGHALQISKSAVIGMAHRLDLPARTSPIKRTGNAPKPPRAPRKSPTSKPLHYSAAASVGDGLNISRRQRSTGELIGPTLPRVAAAAPDVVPAPVPRRVARSSECCWPIGELRTPRFRFCCAPSAAGRPYCDEHWDEAHIKVRHAA